MDIRCDVGCSPWADGSPTVLKQVLSNVLANCVRHAPGSPVRVQVGLRRDRIRLRVSDFGPGVPAGLGRRCSKEVRATRPPGVWV
ncbi:MAG: ATP-binding protein [Pseudonocardia sp.]